MKRKQIIKALRHLIDSRPLRGKPLERQRQWKIKMTGGQQVVEYLEDGKAVAISRFVAEEIIRHLEKKP